MATNVPKQVALDTKSVTPGAIIAAVRDEISYDLSIQDALARDYANVSAISRMLQPRIEERLGKAVNVERARAWARLRLRPNRSTTGFNSLNGA